MNKKTILYIILIMVIIIFIVGCTSQTGNPPPTGAPIGGGC